MAEEGAVAFRGSGRPSELAEKLARLKRELARAKEEWDILKNRGVLCGPARLGPADRVRNELR